jgi:hypothetical protein
VQIFKYRQAEKSKYIATLDATPIATQPNKHKKTSGTDFGDFQPIANVDTTPIAINKRASVGAVIIPLNVKHKLQPINDSTNLNEFGVRSFIIRLSAKMGANTIVQSNNTFTEIPQMTGATGTPQLTINKVAARARIYWLGGTFNT